MVRHGGQRNRFVSGVNEDPYAAERKAIERKRSKQEANRVDGGATGGAESVEKHCSRCNTPGHGQSECPEMPRNKQKNGSQPNGSNNRANPFSSGAHDVSGNTGQSSQPDPFNQDDSNLRSNFGRPSQHVPSAPTAPVYGSFFGQPSKPPSAGATKPPTRPRNQGSGIGISDHHGNRLAVPVQNGQNGRNDHQQNGYFDNAYAAPAQAWNNTQSGVGGGGRGKGQGQSRGRGGNRGGRGRGGSRGGGSGSRYAPDTTVNDLGNSLEGVDTMEVEPPYPQTRRASGIPCRYWPKGTCSKGSNCGFKHVGAPGQQLSGNPFSTPSQRHQISGYGQQSANLPSASSSNGAQSTTVGPVSSRTELSAAQATSVLQDLNDTAAISRGLSDEVAAMWQNRAIDTRYRFDGEGDTFMESGHDGLASSGAPGLNVTNIAINIGNHHSPATANQGPASFPLPGTNASSTAGPVASALSTKAAVAASAPAPVTIGAQPPVRDPSKVTSPPVQGQNSRVKVGEEHRPGYRIAIFAEAPTSGRVAQPQVPRTQGHAAEQTASGAAQRESASQKPQMTETTGPEAPASATINATSAPQMQREQVSGVQAAVEAKRREHAAMQEVRAAMLRSQEAEARLQAALQQAASQARQHAKEITSWQDINALRNHVDDILAQFLQGSSLISWRMMNSRINTDLEEISTLERHIFEAHIESDLSPSASERLSALAVLRTRLESERNRLKHTVPASEEHVRHDVQVQFPGQADPTPAVTTKRPADLSGETGTRPKKLREIDFQGSQELPSFVVPADDQVQTPPLPEMTLVENVQADDQVQSPPLAETTVVEEVRASPLQQTTESSMDASIDRVVSVSSAISTPPFSTTPQHRRALPAQPTPTVLFFQQPQQNSSTASQIEQIEQDLARLQAENNEWRKKRAREETDFGNEIRDKRPRLSKSEDNANGRVSSSDASSNDPTVFSQASSQSPTPSTPSETPEESKRRAEEVFDREWARLQRERAQYMRPTPRTPLSSPTTLASPTSRTTSSVSSNTSSNTSISSSPPTSTTYRRTLFPTVTRTSSRQSVRRTDFRITRDWTPGRPGNVVRSQPETRKRSRDSDEEVVEHTAPTKRPRQTMCLNRGFFAAFTPDVITRICNSLGHSSTTPSSGRDTPMSNTPETRLQASTELEMAVETSALPMPGNWPQDASPPSEAADETITEPQSFFDEMEIDIEGRYRRWPDDDRLGGS